MRFFSNSSVHVHTINLLCSFVKNVSKQQKSAKPTNIIGEILTDYRLYRQLTVCLADVEIIQRYGC